MIGEGHPVSLREDWEFEPRSRAVARNFSGGQGKGKEGHDIALLSPPGVSQASSAVSSAPNSAEQAGGEVGEQWGSSGGGKQ